MFQVYAKGAAFEVEIPIVRTTWEKIRITNQVQTTYVYYIDPKNWLKKKIFLGISFDVNCQLKLVI